MYRFQIELSPVSASCLGCFSYVMLGVDNDAARS